MTTITQSTVTPSSVNVLSGSQSVEHETNISDNRSHPSGPNSESRESTSDILEDDEAPDFLKYHKILRRCKKDDYLQSDYRDPEPRKLPPVAKEVWRKSKDVCAQNKDISEKELASNEIVWEQLHEMNLLKPKKYRNYAQFRNKQRDILFNMPVLNSRELRRGKTPATIHIPLELEEDKLYFASRFLSGIISLQNQIIEEIPSYKLELKPLSEMPNMVNFLGDVLRKINVFMLEDQFEKLISLAFYTARHFEKKKECWSWLANEFYRIAQKFSKGYERDFGYSEALINYMYGRFQLLIDHNPKSAIKSFSRAQELSSGKLWEAEWVTGVNTERLTVYSSYLYHIALLMEADHVAKDQPAKAAKYAERATEILKEGNWHPDLEEALMDLAIYKTQCKKYDEAILILEDLENNFKKEGEDEKTYKDMFMCIQVLLALCYQRGRRPDEALRQLHYASEVAQEWNQPRLLAIIHKHLGEYYMNLGRPVSARKYLVSAIIINNREQNYKELVRNLYLYGYSKGFQFTKQYVELLYAAEEPGSEAFNKLLQFLSTGKPFWDVQEEKRYVIVPKRRPILEKKKRLNATDKVYKLLKKKFGKDFADHCLDEIKIFSKSPEFERAINLHEDPVAKKFFKTLTEAEDWRDYLQKKYQQKNALMKKEFGEYIQFDIEERMVESKETEENFRENLNCVDPIIPYKKGSLMYKQAIETIDSYLNPKPKPNKIFIPYPGPKAASRLLNTLPEVENIEFCSEEPIDISEIAKQMALMKIRHNQNINKCRETIINRYKPTVLRPVSDFKCQMDHII